MWSCVKQFSRDSKRGSMKEKRGVVLFYAPREKPPTNLTEWRGKVQKVEGKQKVGCRSQDAKSAVLNEENRYQPPC